MEAVRLPDRTADFRSDNPDIPFSYIAILHQDYAGGLPDPSVAGSYAEAIGDPDFPVLADPAAAIVDASPWTGDALPGKCVLTPQMEMLSCYIGDDDEQAMELIVEHWKGQP